MILTVLNALAEPTRLGVSDVSACGTDLRFS
jgi:hypothetical protein